jgi:hypothetical protein
LIKVESKGSFEKTEKFLYEMQKAEVFKILNQYGKEGVDALASATPVDSGLTASSWEYEAIYKNGRYSIIWSNTNVKSGIPVAVLIQYGHATGTGGWVEGTDYINPSIKPLFDKIAENVWERVKNA